MKKILLLSAAVMAILAGPALAQDDHGRGHEGRGGDRGGHPAAPAPAAAPARGPAPAPAAAPANRAEAGRQSMQRQQVQRAAPAADRNAGARDDHRGDNHSAANRGNDNRGNDNRGNAYRGNTRNDYRPGNNNNNAFRGRPNPNYAQYHRAFNAPHRYRYRGPAYHQPSGFYYRRWSYGDFLPSLFWGQSYWINDFGYYDLMAPPPGAVWVRYGDDAVLIDRYTGEVIQVEYSVFY